MKPIYFDLNDKEISEILRQYYEAQGFRYGGSQRDKGSPVLGVQLYVDDITKLGKE